MREGLQSRSGHGKIGARPEPIGVAPDPCHRSARRSANPLSPVLVSLFAVASAGCSQKGTIAFHIDAPDRKELSPFLDVRRDTVVLTQGGGIPLANAVNTSAPAGTPIDIGDINVGSYDLLQLGVSGGGQLLGLARVRNVVVLPEQPVSVNFHVRKPLAFFGATTRFMSAMPQLPPPGPLMGFDTTLPVTPVLTAVPLPDQALTAASTHDGLQLFSASPGKLVALDTGQLYTRAPVSVTIRKAPGASAPPVPRTIVVSPDDAVAVVVTDQGISLFQPSAFPDMAPQGIETIRITNARRAAFSPDGTKVAVLAGPSWEEIDCTQLQQPSASYMLITVADGSAGPLTPAPSGATDIGFDASGELLFAVPCGGLRAGITNTALVPILPGTGIYDIVRIGDRLMGVQGTLEMVRASDPDDSGLRGKLAAATPPINNGRQFSYPQFVIPSDSITVEITSMGVLTQVRLKPTSIVAYRADATPDGSNLVFLQRMRYQASQFEFFVLVNNITNQKAFYCTLDALRDVYRLTMADVSTGAIGYQSTKGINDVSKCAITCYDCFFGNCNRGQPDTRCTVNDGFVPDGLSVMMGGE